MSSYLTAVLALFITILSMDNISFAQEDTDLNQGQQISRALTVDSDPLTYRNEANQNTKLSYLADNILAIFILANSDFTERDSGYYLPLYNLNRQKEYFLLI